MWLELGHVIFVSFPFSCLLFNQFPDLLIPTLRGRDQPRDLIFMDHPAPLPRDSSVRAANRAEGERLRKAKEDKKRKRQWKLQARERGEDTDSDDDDDDGDDDEVADDVEWDILENEDALIGIGLSLQELGPFPFHGGEGMFEELAEAGHTIGLPQESTGSGGTATTPKMSAEAGVAEPPKL